jgi:hypothetical protein
MDCHNSHARPDGFLGLLPGIRQEEWHHIHAASRFMDFSLTFPNWSPNSLGESSDPLFYLSQIKNSLEKSTMPPSNFKIFHESDGVLLTFAETQTIINWVDQSTQLLAAANTSKPTASQFFSSNCLGCHTSNNPSGGFAFNHVGGQVTVPTGNAKNGIPFVDQLNPENSAIYLVLLTDPTLRKGLPQMPYGGSVTASQAQFVSDWIKRGAQ